MFEMDFTALEKREKYFLKWYNCICFKCLVLGVFMEILQGIKLILTTYESAKIFIEMIKLYLF